MNRVYFEVFESFEGFATNLAGKVPNGVMDITHVARPLLIRSEGLATLVALERMLARVDSHMHFQMGAMFESRNNNIIKQ